MQVAELEAQVAVEPVRAGEKEATSQSVEQLEARVQTKDQVSQGLRDPVVLCLGIQDL